MVFAFQDVWKTEKRRSFCGMAFGGSRPTKIAKKRFLGRQGEANFCRPMGERKMSVLDRRMY